MRISHKGERVLAGAVQALIELAGCRDRYFVGQAKAVTTVADRMAESLGLSPRERHIVHLAGLLHDVGRACLRDDVLNKTEALTEQDLRHIEEHVAFSEKALTHLFTSREMLLIVRHHHEWWNGRGYPDGLRGDSIPCGAQILAVADAYVEMTQERPDRQPMSREKALARIQAGAGSQFSPKAVSALLSSPPSETALPFWRTAAETARPKSVRRRLERTLKLRAMPNVVCQIMAIRPDDPVSTDQLAVMIRNDPGLVTRLLGVANSVAYSGRSKLDSVDRAVVRLGVDRIRELAIAIGVVDLWRDAELPDGISHAAFWEHSIATALIARHIAQACNLPQRDSVFTAGLIHDIGCLVMLDALGRQYVGVIEEAATEMLLLSDVEQKRLGIDHASAVVEFAQNWGLPDTLARTIAAHHSPWTEFNQLPGDSRLPALCVRIANILASALGASRDHLGCLEMIPADLLAALGIAPGMLDRQLAEVPNQILDLASAYGLSVPRPQPPGTPSSQDPPREGFYIAEDEPVLDPVAHYMVRQNVPHHPADSLRRWAERPGDRWCWIRATTTSFAEWVLSNLNLSNVDRPDPADNLLVLLPLSTPTELRQRLSAVGVPFLVEPWPTAALEKALAHMRAPLPAFADSPANG